VNFTGAIGFSIVLPFLVFLVHQWGGNALIYGLATAIYSVFQLFGAPIMGRWSDRFGRRRVLALSLLGTAVSWAVVLAAFYLPTDVILSVDSSLLGKFSLTAPLILLFAGRALDGLTSGNSAVADAYVADITPEDRRDERFGKMGVSSNLGYIIGPAIVGVLGGTFLGYELPVIFAMGISLLAVGLIIVVLPDLKKRTTLEDPHAAEVHKVMGQEHCSCIQMAAPGKKFNLDLLRLPGIGIILSIYFLVMLAFNFFYVSFPVQAATEMHWSSKHTGAFFSVMSIFMVAVQGFLLPRLLRVCSDKYLIWVGSLVLGLGFLSLAPATDWFAFGGAVLIAVGNGLMWPPVVALLSKASGEHQGAVQGLAGAVSAMASILGLTLGGLFYPHLGDWLFVLSAALIFGVVILTVCLPEGQSQKTQAT
jgi:MFS family permease